MNAPITAAGLDSYHNQGYLIVRRAFSPERVQSLLDAVNLLLDRALAGKCEVRWIDENRRLPQRISSTLHPDKYDPAYAEWLAADLAPHLEKLVVGPLRHSLFGMLAAGGEQPYEQAWHRDLGKPGDPDEEDYYRRLHGRFVQFNAPLLPGDRFLNIVPASHLRASTRVEIEAAAAGIEADMPGALIVELEPGDIAYYDANLWHRGWNPQGIKRWTVHCAFWRAADPVMRHEHGQREAMLTEGHLESMPSKARQYIQRYLDNYPEEPGKLQDL